MVWSSEHPNTERLRLVPIDTGLADDLFRLHQDPGIARWYAGTWTLDYARRRAASMGKAWRADGVHKWMAYRLDDGELIGRGGLSYSEVDGARRLEIGWAVRERFWGQGYASEIGRAGVTLAFDGLGASELVAFTEEYNRRSRAVMTRLGFHYDRQIVHDGEPFALYVLRDKNRRG
jgi:RimJ/RimL family protein N-acetyltransferase